MFDTASLNAQTGRYALIAESILPPLCIFIIGGLWFRPKSKNLVKGQPPGFAFGLIWFLLVTMWLIALVIVACDTLDTLSLCLIGIFSFLSLVGSMMWLYFYSNENRDSIYSLLFAFVFMMATTFVTLGSETPSSSKIVASIFFGFVASWLSIASLLGYLELNAS